LEPGQCAVEMSSSIDNRVGEKVYSPGGATDRLFELHTIAFMVSLQSEM